MKTELDSLGEDIYSEQLLRYNLNVEIETEKSQRVALQKEIKTELASLRKEMKNLENNTE